MVLPGQWTGGSTRKEHKVVPYITNLRVLKSCTIITLEYSTQEVHRKNSRILISSTYHLIKNKVTQDVTTIGHVRNIIFCIYTLVLSVMSPSVMSLHLTYIPKPLGMDVLCLHLPLCCHISLPHITCFDIKIIPKKFKPHVRTHHILIIVLIAMLTLSYSIMSHAYNNSLLSHIHVNSTNLINITCTLVATSMKLERLECIKLI